MVILFFTDCIESFVFSFRFISVLVPNSQNLCLLGPSWTLKVQTLSSVRDRALLHLWMLRCNYRRSSIKCKYRAAILFFCLKTVICSIKVCLICSLRKIVWDKIFNKWLFWLTPPDPVLETVSFHWKLLPFEPARTLSLSGICETVPQVRRAEGCNCECLKMWEMIMPSWPSMGSNLRNLWQVWFASVAIVSVLFYEIAFLRPEYRSWWWRYITMTKRWLRVLARHPTIHDLGGGGGWWRELLSSCAFCSRDHVIILAHWIQLSQLYHQPNWTYFVNQLGFVCVFRNT